MNTQTNHNFLKSLPMVAGILGNKLGVDVELGSKCCTNGRVIELPLALQERAITREELLGFLVHEASHVRFTDFSVQASTPLHFKLMNAIEDARIEKQIAEHYPGAQYLLNRCYEPMLASMSTMLRKMDPASAFVSYALFATQNTFNPLFASIKDATRARAVDLLGEKLMTNVDSELVNFPNLGSTADVRDLAQKLLELLKQAASAPQANKSSHPSKTDASPQCSGVDPNSASDDAVANQKEKTRSSKNSSHCSDIDASDFVLNAQKAHQGKPEKIKCIDLSEQLREKIEKHAAPQPCSSPTRLTTDFSCPEVSSPLQKDRLRGQLLLQQAYADSVAARRALLGAIQTKVRTGYYTANHGRRINPSRMGRLTAGSTRVFERREEVHAIDTSVSILLDLSGSVGQALSELAIRACLAMMAALRSISFVKSTLNVFPCAAGLKVHVNNGYYFKVVPFEDKIEKHVDLIGTLTSFGGTPLAEALLGTAAELSQRPEHKRIIFVVTDGRVCVRGQEILKELRHSCTIVGIFIGISVNNETLRGLFDVCEELRSFGQLQTTLMSISQALILKGLG